MANENDKEALISSDYLKQQQWLHQNCDDYGIKSVLFSPIVSTLINQLNIKNMLDYGCGKGRLLSALTLNHSIECFQYDPAIEKFSSLPDPQEFVCCIDVLEHIEPENLDSVFNHLHFLILKYGFFTIHTEAAIKILPDGRNAHLIQQPKEWWLPKINARFNIIQIYELPDGFACLILNKKYQIKN
jgi:Methyltransferase domain